MRVNDVQRVPYIDIGDTQHQYDIHLYRILVYKSMGAYCVLRDYNIIISVRYLNICSRYTRIYMISV
jgi:hypothetical protein